MRSRTRRDCSYIISDNADFTIPQSPSAPAFCDAYGQCPKATPHSGVDLYTKGPSAPIMLLHIDFARLRKNFAGCCFAVRVLYECTAPGKK